MVYGKTSKYVEGFKSFTSDDDLMLANLKQALNYSEDNLSIPDANLNLSKKAKTNPNTNPNATSNPNVNPRTTSSNSNNSNNSKQNNKNKMNENGIMPTGMQPMKPPSTTTTTMAQTANTLPQSVQQQVMQTQPQIKTKSKDKSKDNSKNTFKDIDRFQNHMKYNKNNNDTYNNDDTDDTDDNDEDDNILLENSGTKLGNTLLENSGTEIANTLLENSGTEFDNTDDKDTENTNNNGRHNKTRRHIKKRSIEGFQGSVEIESRNLKNVLLALLLSFIGYLVVYASINNYIPINEISPQMKKFKNLIYGGVFFIIAYICLEVL
jgi:hypothetical protein